MQTQQARNIFPVPKSFQDFREKGPWLVTEASRTRVVSRVFQASQGTREASQKRETRRVPLDPVARVSRFTPASCFVPLKKGGGGGIVPVLQAK